MGQKYQIGAKFKSEFTNEDGKTDSIEFRVVDYEESILPDKDDHYEVCFDEEFNLKLFTKQSNLDKLDRIN
jgi:hypothetical protein